MKKTTKKRQILAATLVIALAAAVMVNWYYSKSVPPTGSETDGETQQMLGDSLLVAGTAVDEAAQPEKTEEEAAAAAAYFSEMQLKQTQQIDAVKTEIEAVLSAETLDDDAQQQVVSLLETLQTQTKAQTDCEALIKAKLGGEVLVLLGDDGAQVVVDTGRLNEQSTLQITEIMENNAGVAAENLTIMEANS